MLAIGFSVDYSAHIAHAYVHSTAATSNDRVRHALKVIGRSVACGGFSTWLSVCLLPASVGYFFKIVLFRSLSFTVLFGLFHGLCVLPVLLSYLPIKGQETKSILAVGPVESGPVKEAAPPWAKPPTELPPVQTKVTML